jgi:hypothetical protein
LLHHQPPLKSPDCGGVDVEASAHIRLCLAGCKASQRFPPLMRRQLARPTEAHTAFLGAFAALAGPGADQFPLKFSQATEYGQHQPAMGSCRVRPGILERLEFGLPLGDRVQDIQ